ncbi:MAG TPA: hypothetical protein VKP88_05190 [Candidatus Paceibacterota bacterium]|nr:hypothetical protein [Candidatus Paceibacterota bacterium]
MAFPTVSAPYGFKPINRLDGMPYAGATRQIKIASGYAANVFNGDLVSVVTGGVVEKFAGTTSGSPVGVFVGCSYTNPTTKQKQFAQYWPTGTVADDAVAYVVDDPNAVFKVAITDSSSDMSNAALAAVGANVAIVQGTGDTNTGNSGVSVLAGSEATTATLPVRVISVVPETATGSDEFVELIVKINIHQYNNTTGV